MSHEEVLAWSTVALAIVTTGLAIFLAHYGGLPENW